MDLSSQPNPKGAATPHIQYQNPIPVAVAIVPVHAINPATGQKQLGLLAIERGIPLKRELSLYPAVTLSTKIGEQVS